MKRTIVPRLSAILYSLIFLVMLFFLARSLHSKDAAWAAVAAASVMDGMVNFGRSARYYSPTLAFTTLCALAVWRLKQNQRFRDFAFAAGAMVLLFHTHPLSLAVMLLMFSVMGFWFRRADRLIPKLALFSTILTAGTLPWVWLTGFLDTLAASPKAWPLLDFPADLLWFPRQRIVFAVIVVLGLAWLALCMLFRRRSFHPFTGRAVGMFFLVLWVLSAYLLFIFTIPAASFFVSRMSLMTIVPGLLLFCVTVAAFVQEIAGRFSGALTLLLVITVLVAAGRINLYTLRSYEPGGKFLDMVDIMREWEVGPGTRFYADPNRHLILTYYSGMPVQSIAPVRRSFLNETQDDVIFIETTSAGTPLWIGEVLESARIMGLDLTREQAWAMLCRLDAVIVGRWLQGRVSSIWPRVRELTPFEERLARSQVRTTRNEIGRLKSHAPVFRGYDFQQWRDWWPVFFYRFSNVEARWRDNASYAERIREATALVLPWGWVVYDCGRHGPSVFDSEIKLDRAWTKASACFERGILAAMPK